MYSSSLSIGTYTTKIIQINSALLTITSSPAFCSSWFPLSCLPLLLLKKLFLSVKTYSFGCWTKSNTTLILGTRQGVLGARQNRYLLAGSSVLGPYKACIRADLIFVCLRLNHASAHICKNRLWHGKVLSVTSGSEQMYTLFCLSFWKSKPHVSNSRPMGRFWYTTSFYVWPALWVTSARPARAWWVKKTLYWSNISYYLFMLALRKSGDLSPPGCARRVNQVTSFRWELEEKNGVMKFYWQALFNDWHWLNILKPSDLK